MLKTLFVAALSTSLLVQNAQLTVAEDPSDAQSFSSDVTDTAQPNVIPIEDESSDAYGITVEYHSIDSIKTYVRSNGPDFMKAKFTEAPNYTSAPYSAGVMSSDALNDALKTVNTVRYIAGLNYNVKLDGSYTSKVQAGVLLNAINNKMTHDPVRPAGVSDDLYNLGLEGCGSSNLAKGFNVLANSVIGGWLDDGDENNIDRIGHRRWLLNAKMGKTGFGSAGAYSGMYAFDTSGSTGKTSNVWPAQNTPIEFFGADYPWSISTGAIEDIDKIHVYVTDMSNENNSFHFSKDNSDGFFTVNNENYGVPGAVIWRPDGIEIAKNKSYKVLIKGLSTGEAQYTVTFFQLYSGAEMIVNTDSIEIGVGETAEINAEFIPATSKDYLKTFDVSYTIPVPFNADFGSEPNTIVITGTAVGSGTITLTSSDGLTAECAVKVINKATPATGITVAPSTLALTAGETAQLTATVTPDNADDKTVTWSTSDNSVVTVDNGTVTAIGAGTATITASTVNGLTATCEVTVEKKPISIYGSSLALEGKIGINFYLNIAEEDLNDLTVVMQMDEKEDVRVPASEGLASTVSGQKLRMFVYPVAAKEMRDKVTLTVENKSGDKVKLIKDDTDYTEGYPFSAADYFAKAETAGQERTKKLARVLNNYGKYAQIYFNYNTDEVTDLTDVSAVTLETLAPYQVVQTENKVAGLTYVGGTTMLDDAVGYRLYFKIDTSHKISDYTFKMDGKKVTPVKSGSQYYIEKTDIAAKDLGVKNTIEVTDGENTFGIQYCALSYAYRALELTAEDKIPLQNMCRAMYLYNQQAIEYFEN